MPTLTYVPASQAEARNDESAGRNERIEVDDSATVYNSDESTVFDENHNPKNNHQNEDGATKSDKYALRDGMASPDTREKHNKSVTFDESFLLLSSVKKGRYSRRDTLNSDVSLLSCDDSIHSKRRSFSASLSNNDCSFDPNQESHTLSRDKTDRQLRPWPRRDEYNEKYQPYVKSTISEFQSKYPGKLRDYRSMSLEEKTHEQQTVVALLTRLGVSKADARSNNMIASPTAHRHDSFKSPVRTNLLLDDTLSPMFSPDVGEPDCDYNVAVPSSPLNEQQNDENEEISVDLNLSKYQGEKSELLLSMEVEDDSGTSSRNRKQDRSNHGVHDQEPIENNDDDCDDDGDFEFPSNNDKDDDSSNGSMEIVRRTAVDSSNISDKRLSCLTPERMMASYKSSRKREASSSGKRGADLRRTRHNEREDEYGHLKVDDAELSTHLGRLSISPSIPSPPKDLFITSQSPISPNLTYRSPGNDGSNDYSDDNCRKRISLGRDSNERMGLNRRNSRRDSNITNDSLATNTPPKRYRSEKDKSRAFRDVPVNVVLKKGATFHLEKIEVKRTERVSSKTTMSKNRRVIATQRRRLVNFPDPLVRYSSRRRRALKEMYTWVRRAERDYEEGVSIIPAVGAFFSLSEQQIIDVSLKLFLSDYKEKSYTTEPQNSESTSELKGNSLVVCRTKDDTANWENALREGTGCAVFNHSTLPLSERIRASTSEKACLHDVVLTTYDAMKSPDITISLSDDGRAILTKAENDGGWHSSRSETQQDQNTRKQTKQLSVLHRIQFKRIIFVDTLGRKCYLGKSNTARAIASVALSSSSCRLVFFKESEADGSNAYLALRKSDKRAFQSVSSVLHLGDNTNESSCIDDDSSNDDREDPLESIAMDLKDLLC